MRTRTPAPRRSVRAAIGVGVLVLGVIAGLLTPLGAAPAAEAATATGGSGRFTQSIDWFQWGTHGSVVTNGTQVNTTRIAGQDLTVSCAISNLSGGLLAYRPGTWRGDALDDLYNRGGTGTANQLQVGLQTQFDNQTVTFDLACSASYGGQPLQLGGLVFADAEQSRNAEMVAATAPSGTTWHMIDRYRDASCTQSTTATRPVGDPSRLQLTGASASSDCVSGPAAVAFASGARQLTNVTVRGSGKSAIALGVMLSLDFGDAPEGYGAAGAVFQPGWSGGVPEAPSCTLLLLCSDGTTNVFTMALASVTQSVPRLGATVDADGGYPVGSRGQADDLAGDDEDTTFTYRDAAGQQVTDAAKLDLPAIPGSSQSVTVSCTGAGAAVRAWLDFDRNGTFDLDEQSTATTCGASTADRATVTWTVPADARPATESDPAFLRVRIANAGTALTPTGMTTTGEVEDHPIALVAPAIAVTKTADAAAAAVPGQRVTYAVTLRNAGRTELRTPTIADDLTSVLDGASFVAGSAAVSPVGGQIVAPSSADPARLRWSSTVALGAGQSVTLTYQVLVTDARRGQLLTNAVTATGLPPTMTTPLTASATTQTAVAVSLSVSKEWVVDGVRYQHGARPAGLHASVTATGPASAGATALPWGAVRDGYARGASVTITEVTTFDAGVACRLVSATITGDGIAQQLPPSGVAIALQHATNALTITNTVTCDTRLTLVNVVGFGSASPDAWTLRASAPDGSGLSGTTGATGAVRAGAALALSQSGGSATYVQQGPWACVDVATAQPVALADGAVRVALGTHVRCTATQATAQLTLLKHIDPTSGGTLDASMFDLRATPAQLAGLAPTTVRGSETQQSTNRFDVRPSHTYVLSESSSYASIGLRLERLVDGRWVTAEAPSIQVAAGQHAVYRFVNAPVPALSLPLTGGVGADAYVVGGSALLLLAAALLLVRQRMRRSNRP